MKVVFMGTPEYAVPSLIAFADAGYDIVGVYTQPDRPKGRGKKLLHTPVKETALEYGFDVYQPETLKTDEAFEEFKSLNPDICIVVAYGQVLPERFLNIPKYGCVNAHGSILPKYRGAAPIQWAVLNGEKETGVTTMYMEKGLDTGDILLIDKTDILKDETSGELHERLSKMSADLLLKTVSMLKSTDITPVKQSETGIEPTYASMLTKDLSPIDFNKNAMEIHDQIRGLNPWPTASFKYKDKNVKVFKSEVFDDKIEEKAGTLLSDDNLIISCGEGSVIEFKEVQMAGKNKVTGAEFLRGYRLKKGHIF